MNQIELVGDVLREKGYQVIIAENKTIAKEIVDSFVIPGSNIGLGGSQTIKECGILDSLIN